MMQPAETNVAETHPPGPTPNELHAIRAFFGAIRTRIVSGLILALPIAITLWIVYQLYLTLQGLVIGPTTDVILWLLGPDRVRDLPAWWRKFVSPVVALASVLALLYFLGLFVSTRLAKFIDWLMSRVPVVTTIYHAVRGDFEARLGRNTAAAKHFARALELADTRSEQIFLEQRLNHRIGARLDLLAQYRDGMGPPGDEIDDARPEAARMQD